MAITIEDGKQVEKDPNDALVYTMDWGTKFLADGVSISTSSWTITGMSGDTSTTPLTKDQESISGQTTRIRLSAGAIGSKWRIDNAIVTDETPAQTIDRGFVVKVENL